MGQSRKWWGFLSLIVFANVPVFAQEGEIVDKIIAKIDDNIILKSELETAYIQFLSSPDARNFDGDARCLILRNYIESKVMLAMADIDSTYVDANTVDFQLEGRRQRIVAQFGSEKAIEDYYGKTMDQFMEELRPAIEEQLRIQQQEQLVVGDVNVTPADIRRFFNQIPKDSLPLYSTEYEVGVIVKKPEPSDSEEQRVRDQLIKIRERALNGESFEILALEYSEGPSKTNGGNLGFATRGAMDPAYEAGALALKPGEISMPVKSAFGYHLIQLIEKRGNEYNSRHILIRPKPSQKEFDQVTQFLDSIRQEVLAGNMKFEDAAKEFSDDRTTKVNGGFMSSSAGSNKIPAGDLDPALFFKLDEMKEGDISKPELMKMGLDEQAARIIYFRKKMPPHRANLRDDYEKLKLAATQVKMAEARSKYLERKMQEVYIEIDPEYKRCGIINN